MNTEKNLSLWQLTNEHQKLLSELYDYETGEVNEIVQAKLDSLEPSIEKKCISVTKYIRKLESEERELEILLNEVTQRKKSFEREREKYKKYLQDNMERQGIKEIVCPFFSVRLRKNPYSTEIINDELIPEKFMRTREIIKVEVKPDKEAIKEEVIKTGEQIPGAYVSQKDKLEILISKI